MTGPKSEVTTPRRPVFLLSPADCGGKRAATLFRPGAAFDLALRLRTPEGAPLGEVFSYVSGLYFRGKLTYARHYGGSATAIADPLIITSGWGLLPSSTMVTLDDLYSFASVPIDLDNPRYSEPLRADAELLEKSLPTDSRVVLLGSIATPKYVDLLLTIFGSRLCFPGVFVGIGDMSRGAILLRAVSEEIELDYVAAMGAVRTRATRPLPRPR